MDFNDFNFKEKKEKEEIEIEIESNFIDIYIKQRNGRKSITMIEGLGDDKNKLKLIVKELRKKMSCGGSVSTNKDGNLYIKFSGKDLENIVKYLINVLNYDKDDIRIHGS